MITVAWTGIVDKNNCENHCENTKQKRAMIEMVFFTASNKKPSILCIVVGHILM